MHQPLKSQNNMNIFEKLERINELNQEREDLLNEKAQFEKDISDIIDEIAEIDRELEHLAGYDLIFDPTE